MASPADTSHGSPCPTTVIHNNTASSPLNRPPRVLVVEDDLTSREFLRRALEKNRCQVEAADCADNAQSIFVRRGPLWFDSVLTDYRMPGRNGLELLAWIREEDSCLTGILLTAEGEKELVAESLRAGVSDFLEKPINLQNLLTALGKAVETTHRLRHLAATESAVQSLGRTQRDLINARPIPVPGGAATLEICFHPRLEAGGDFFSSFQPAPDRLCCLLTDVSGHDLRAAYISAYFQGVVRGMLERSAPVPDIFRHFNQFLLNEWNETGHFRLQKSDASTSVAALAVVLDFTAQSTQVLTCGSPAPVLISADGRAQLLRENGGAALGWFPDWNDRGTMHPHSPGGRILMWTDGLEDFAQHLELHPLCAAHSLELAHRNGNESALLEGADDDVLYASLQLPGGAAMSDTSIPLLLDEYHGGQTNEIDFLAARWQRHLRFAVPAISEAAEHDILLGTREAVLNAMKHGCGGGAENHFQVQLNYQPLARTVKVWVQDPGNGHAFDFTAHASNAIENILDEHRGLIFMVNLARSVKFERNGATVIMEFNV